MLTEQRVQTSAERYRIADVCVVRECAPFERVVQVPPLLCIEILSWDDRLTAMQERVQDYFGMGVTAVWVVDPRRRRAFYGVPAGSLQAAVEELTIAGTEVRLPVSAIFAELDQLEGKLE